MPSIPERKISPFIREQLPDFVNDEILMDTKAFIAFLEAYYEWMENEGNVIDSSTHLLDYRDVDKTLDKFISHFTNEFMPNIPVQVLANKRLLVKHIKEFYRAKGSEKSFKFLFRILFNEDVEFYYPKVDLIKASHGIWSVGTIIRTTTTNDSFRYISRNITGYISRATASVENVLQYYAGAVLVSELTLSNIQGSFIPEEQLIIHLEEGDFLETILGLISKVEITNPGKGYKVNDTVSFIGGDGQDVFAVVSSVFGADKGYVITSTNSPNTITLDDQRASAIAKIDPATNKVIEIPLVSRGRNYTAAPTVTISGGSPTTPATAISLLDSRGFVKEIQITNPGVGYLSAPTVVISPAVPSGYYNNLDITIIEGKGAGQKRRITNYVSSTRIATVDQAWAILPDHTSKYSINLGKIKEVTIKNFGVGYSTAPQVFFNSGDGLAQGEAIIGALGRSDGTWLNTNGFLSSNKKLQDSKYWQDYSYVLKVGLSANIYKNVLLNLLHPAGLVMFGTVDLHVTHNVGVTYAVLDKFKFSLPPYTHYGQTSVTTNNSANSWIGQYDGKPIIDAINGVKHNHIPDSTVIISIAGEIQNSDAWSVFDSGFDPLYDASFIDLV